MAQGACLRWREVSHSGGHGEASGLLHLAPGVSQERKKGGVSGGVLSRRENEVQRRLEYALPGDGERERAQKAKKAKKNNFG